MSKESTSVQVPAALVSALRQKTGAGINKCKEALVATGANLEEAERWLRIQGVKPEVLSRETGEGVIAVKLSDDHRHVAMIELLCQTDFAAKSERFTALADGIAEAVLRTPVGSITEALGLKVGEEVLHQVLHKEINGVIKENIKLNHVTALNFTKRPGGIGVYVHSNKKLAVLVGAVTDTWEASEKPEFQQLLKDLAVHIAGTPITPKAAYISELPTSLVESTKQIYLAQLNNDPKNLKKPDNIKAKIIDGKMNSFYKDVALVEQPFVKDEGKTVRQVVEEASKAIGAPITVDWFIRRTLASDQG